MLKTKAIENLLNEKMDRKQFLIRVGILFLTFVGFSKIFKLFGDNKKITNSKGGYGSSPYGG